MINRASNYLVGGLAAKRLGNAHPNIVPYESFRASDRWFNLAVGNDGQYRRLCELIGLPELADDERFRTNPDRVAHREDLIPLLAEVLARGSFP